MKLLKTTILFGLVLSLCACTQHPAQRVRTQEQTTSTGNRYTLFYPQHLAAQVVTHRPSPTDGHTQLSVAAAYTDLTTYQPLDLLVCQGTVRQATATVGFLDGMLTVQDTTLAITRIPKGQWPPSAQVAQVRRQHGSLLLQELLVYEGKNQRGEGGSLFQRRALAEFANHQFAVVESETNQLTMKQFGDDLVELGARNALYLDMGDWDEGWYLRGQEVVKLGNRRTQTARQSNWLVFTELSSAAN